MEINNKYNCGDELYTVVRKPIEYSCPVCNGKGLFSHYNYNVNCPHCNGTGKVRDNKTLWNVTDERVKISRIIESIYNDGIIYKYKVHYSGKDCNINNRSEETLFIKKEDAELWCKKNNKVI